MASPRGFEPRLPP